MVSTFLHFIQIFILALIGYGLYKSYIRGDFKDKEIKEFAVVFFIFAFYQLFLSAMLFTDNLKIAAWSYNIAIFLFFIMLAYAWRIPLSLSGINTKKIRLLLGILFAVGLTTVAIQIYDFRLPIIHSSGLIFWNANPVAAWIARLAGFWVGMTWVYVFSKKFLRHLGRIEKFKNILIIITAFMFGITSLLYFHSNYILTLAAFFTKYVGLLSISILLLTPKNK
jgi:hypothetical protein